MIFLPKLLLGERDTDVQLSSMRFSRRDRVEIFGWYATWPTWWPRDLGPRSNFFLDLLRSKSIRFDPSRREKHDGVIADSLSLLAQKLFVKNEFCPKPDLTYRDLDIDLSEKVTQVTLIGIITRSRMPFIASLYLGFRDRRGFKSSPPPPPWRGLPGGPPRRGLRRGKI